MPEVEQRLSVTTDGTWLRCAFNAMGTEVVAILCGAPLEVDGTPVATWIRNTVERFEQSWSRFRVTSELNQFIKSSGAEFSASRELLLALDCASRLWSATDGLFDARIRSDLERIGYARTYADIGNSGGVLERESPVRSTNSPGFWVDLQRGVAAIERDCAIDLGGVGKGLAADLLCETLMQRGARGACLSFGGDMRIEGEGPDDSAWNIPIHNLHDADNETEEPKVHTVHRCTSGALVMSTTKFRRWSNAAGEHHHIIDPRTGESCTSTTESVAVIGQHAWWAEGLAKAALIVGPSLDVELLRRNEIVGWIFDSSGNVRTTNTPSDQPDYLPPFGVNDARCA